MQLGLLSCRNVCFFYYFCIGFNFYGSKRSDKRSSCTFLLALKAKYGPVELSIALPVSYLDISMPKKNPTITHGNNTDTTTINKLLPLHILLFNFFIFHGELLLYMPMKKVECHKKACFYACVVRLITYLLFLWVRIYAFNKMTTFKPLKVKLVRDFIIYVCYHRDASLIPVS